MSQPTARFRGAVGATAVLALAALVAADARLLLAGLVPLAYVAYGSVTTVEVDPDLEARRIVAPSPAPPGRTVRIKLAVVNHGDRTISDLRVVDGTPEALSVMEGTPRAGTTIEPGERAVLEYTVVARRGEHSFAPPRVRVRSFGGGAVETVDLRVQGDRELICRLDADAPPLADHADRRVGQLTTDSAGRGIEFHSTREYRHSDAANRIDWRHYAKRGQLATVNYQQRKAASVVVVVDAREAARVVSGPGRPTAVELEAYAATHAVSEFLAAGHDVGVAVIGDDGPGPAALHWLPPGSGAGQRSQALDLFRAAADATEDAPDVDAQITEIVARTPPGSQIALFSPVLDDQPVEAVEIWRAHGFPVVTLSPDVLTGNTVSGQYEQVRRHTRLARCQAAGARTLDWRRGTPLPFALEYAFAAEVRRPSNAGTAQAGGGR